MALRGTVPVTSDVVAAGAGADAGDAWGALEPHAAVVQAATTTINVVIRMDPEW